MKRFLTLPRLAAVFFTVFSLALVGLFVMQRVWIDPGDRCADKGWWYDMETRICAQPIYIPDITGRPEGVSRAEASAKANQELLALEAEAAAYDRARRDATNAERARVQALADQ